MAGERSQYVNLNVQTETTFGTAIGSPAYKAVAVLASSLAHDFRREALADDTTRNDVGEHPSIVGSKVGSTFGFNAHASGLTTAAGNGVTPTQTGLGVVLKSIMGAENMLIGDTVAASSPAPGANEFGLVTQTTLTEAEIVIVGVDVAAAGTVRWRPATITSGDATLLYNLPATSVAADVVYGSANYCLQDAVVEATSYEAQLLTDRADEKYQAQGCMADTLTITFTPRQLTTCQVGNVCVDWTDAESASLAYITPPSKSPWFASECILAPFGTATYSATHLRALMGPATFQMGRGLIPREDPNADQGASMWDSPGAPFWQGTMRLPVDDAWRDSWAAGDLFHLFMTSGRTAGKVFGMYVRKCHIAMEPRIVDNGGIMATEVQLRASTGTTAPLVTLFQG